MVSTCMRFCLSMRAYLWGGRCGEHLHAVLPLDESVPDEGGNQGEHRRPSVAMS